MSEERRIVEPEEVVALEQAIKRFQQQIVTLKTKSRDIVTKRNTLEVELETKAEEIRGFEEQHAILMAGDVISLNEYVESRLGIEVLQDELEAGRAAVANYGVELVRIHEQIPLIEEHLEHAKSERAGWGIVIEFRPGA